MVESAAKMESLVPAVDTERRFQRLVVVPPKSIISILPDKARRDLGDPLDNPKGWIDLLTKPVPPNRHPVIDNKSLNQGVILIMAPTEGFKDQTGPVLLGELSNSASGVVLIKRSGTGECTLTILDNGSSVIPPGKSVYKTLKNGERINGLGRYINIATKKRGLFGIKAGVIEIDNGGVASIPNFGSAVSRYHASLGFYENELTISDHFSTYGTAIVRLGKTQIIEQEIIPLAVSSLESRLKNHGANFDALMRKDEEVIVDPARERIILVLAPGDTDKWEKGKPGSLFKPGESVMLEITPTRDSQQVKICQLDSSLRPKDSWIVARDGKKVVIGRGGVVTIDKEKEKYTEIDAADFVSRKHLSLTLKDDGTTGITDESLNGTAIFLQTNSS